MGAKRTGLKTKKENKLEINKGNGRGETKKKQ